MQTTFIGLSHGQYLLLATHSIFIGLSHALALLGFHIYWVVTFDVLDASFIRYLAGLHIINKYPIGLDRVPCKYNQVKITCKK